jgi:hypothetical protein
MGSKAHPSEQETESLDVSDFDLAAQSPSFVEKPRRNPAVRLCLPGIDDSRHRLQARPLKDNPLRNTLVEALSQAPHIDGIELLTISGDGHAEYLLTPILRSTPKGSWNAVGQGTVQDFDTRSSGVPDSTTESLASVAVSTLPEEIGVEVCDVDLSPIRTWPVTTGRVLIQQNASVRQPQFGQNLPAVETIRHLAATGKPYVVQLVLDTSTRAAYVATIRYALLHPDHAIDSDRVTAEALRSRETAPH